MATGQHPDVYVDETSNPGQGIASQPSAVGAYVGPALQGPVNQAVRVSSFPQYVANFGTYTPYSFLTYMAKAHFDQNGGGLSVFVRIVHCLQAAAVAGGSSIVTAPTGTGSTPNTASVVNINLPGATQPLPIGTVLSIGGQVAVVKSVATAAPNSATTQLVTLLNPLQMGIPAVGTIVTDFDPVTFRQSAPAQLFVLNRGVGGTTPKYSRLYQSIYDGNLYRGLSISIVDNPTVTTTLAANASAGATSVTLASSGGLSVNQTLRLGTGSTAETVLVTGILNNVITTSVPLVNSYSSGAPAVETSYDLTVFLFGAQKEIWKQISTSPLAQRYDVATLASDYGGSDYLQIVDLGSTDGYSDYPALTTNAALLSGLDGINNAVTNSSMLTDQDYIGSKANGTGIYALDQVTDVVLHVAVPGITTAAVYAALTAYQENRKDTFGVLDSPLGASPQNMNSLILASPSLNTNRSAIYYPWVKIIDPIGQGSQNTKLIPPCAFAIGQYGRTDKTRGVAKAPAGIDTKLIGAIGLEYYATNDDHDLLNPIGVNVIRSFSGIGPIINGCRTLSSASGDTKFNVVNVRRLFLAIEKDVQLGLKFAVFEGIGDPLFQSIYLYLYQYLLDKYNSNSFAGGTPESSFRIDVNSGNTSATAAQDRVEIACGIAPSRPGEFIHFSISYADSGISVTEALYSGV